MASRLFRILLLWACALLAMPLALASRAADRPPASPPAESAVVELQIDGEIEPILADYIVGGIQQANRGHASLILITLSTPGGLDTSMRAIIEAILNSRVPVVTYVYPTGSRAASAGFFILLSADVDAMSPGTDTGAASPIMEIGGEVVHIDDTLEKKIMNEAEAYLRAYVTKRGRNAALAETAVSDAKAFTETEALKGNLIDLIATSPQNLLAQLNGRTITRLDGSTTVLSLSHPVLVVREMSTREKILTRIVQPDAFFILLILGVLGLYTEFTHPGLFAPGVIGGIAILLALFAMHMLPVNFTGLLLILLAIILFVLEAKYPTHGVLGIGGAIAMVFGALMLVRSPITGMGVSMWAALAVVIPFGVIVIILARLVMRSRSWKSSTGKEELVGELGEVTETVGPAGKPGMARVHGELWQAAAADGGTIPRGSRVKVRRVNGLRLDVEPLETPRSASS